MEPVPLIFSCDTEDYETPASDDAELLWAQLFARHGIRACFCVVGEEARALRDRGRRDVLAALGQHEIASHSDRHSAHPTPAEYLEELSWRDGIARFLEEEGRAARDLSDILGQHPSAWCKPGNSWGPAVPFAAALLGMPVFCDAPFEWAPGRPLHYAGGLLIKYHTSFDRYFAVPEDERLGQMCADFQRLLASRRDAAHRDGSRPGAIVMYTHPCRTYAAAFPENFTAGKNPPRASWRPAPRRPQPEIDALVRDFDRFLGWIAEQRDGNQVILTTYRELHQTFRQPPAPWLPIGEVLALARALAADHAVLEPYRTEGAWLSPAEQFGLIAWALDHAAKHDRLPEDVPVRRLLGPMDDAVTAVADAPETESAAEASGIRRSVTMAEALAGAAQASESCSVEGAVPFETSVGEISLGPGQFLRLAARTLTRLAADGGKSMAGSSFPLPAGGDHTALAAREDFARLRFRQTWSIFPPDFEGHRLLNQARWQTWSAKPA
jgi:peptidoglycan/xylan/chitin deacetylase (PgdA/CDA1 family)